MAGGGGGGILPGVDSLYVRVLYINS
jgi:hypothetical protein